MVQTTSTPFLKAFTKFDQEIENCNPQVTGVIFMDR